MNLSGSRMYPGVAAGVLGLVIGASGALADSSATGTAIGTLESGAAFQVRSAGTREFVRIRQHEFSLFSGDTVRAGGDVAVFNLDSGGGLGLHQGAEVTVSIDDRGRLIGDVIAGKLVYALPDHAAGMDLRAGGFTLSTGSDEVRRVDVARGGAAIGEVHLLTDGHLKVSVHSGALNASRTGATAVTVSAGESRGLLATPVAAPVPVRAPGEIAIMAPDRVGAGAAFQVSWQSAHPIDGDYLVIAPEGTAADEFTAVVSASEGQPLNVTAPQSAGNYEIRVIDQRSGAVASTVPLVVTGSPSASAAVVASGVGSGAGAGGLGAASAITVASGGGAVFLSTRIDDDEESVSP